MTTTITYVDPDSSPEVKAFSSMIRRFEEAEELRAQVQELETIIDDRETSIRFHVHTIGRMGLRIEVLVRDLQRELSRDR